MIFSCSRKLKNSKQLLDPNYSSFWKTLEMSVLESFHPDWEIMFMSDALDCVLNTLSNCQLIESIKLWYLYKNKIMDNLGWSDIHLQDPIWWNKNVRLKSKKFFFTLSGMRRGFVIFQIFFLVIILLKLLKIWLLNLIFPLEIGGNTTL